MATAAERARRDQKVLGLYLAGATYRDIASVVNVSASRVHQIVERELESGADRRELLTTKAADMLIERTEALLRANWPAAMRGDYKAAVIVDRVLARQSRLFGLDTAGGAMPATTIPDGDDELTAWRKRRSTGRSGA